MAKHPIQPLVPDSSGVLRFKENAIVRYLLDNGKIDLNDLARLEFHQEDREQFAQLIGYSLSGYGDLPYVSNRTYDAAARMAGDPEASALEARVADLEGKLSELRSALAEPIAALFGVHPDDLMSGHP